ncbi:MAG TPA: hypothetical protein PLR71_01435 [Deltaproteobacteria bacterium]|nr:hypothetical protein [Deltaproteobacteria bacterium]HQI80194.1 hypothetical protein [Deltaproteobacteria bacterium]
MQDHPEACLDITMTRDALHHLFLLMQNGFSLRITRPCSLLTFLTEKIGLERDFIEERIQTIFLNGKPVDDLASAAVGNGSSLALSAAMPGLVGAALRRGGYYGALRSSITHPGETEPGGTGGMVRVKIFNLLLEEMGPGLLEAGILVAGPDMVEFLGRQEASFWDGCTQIMLNGSPLNREALLGKGALSVHETVLVRAKTVPGTSELCR